MDSMRIYVIDLSQSVAEKEYIGCWFTLPIDMEEVVEEIGGLGSDSEYIVGGFSSNDDFSSLLGIDEGDHISYINFIYRCYQEFCDKFDLSLDDLKRLIWGSGLTLYRLYLRMNEIVFYANCHDMVDVAKTIMENSGMLDGASSSLYDFINYDKFIAQLTLKNNYVECPSGIFMIPSE